MTIINGKRVILVDDDIRVVIDSSIHTVEKRYVDATGCDSWISCEDSTVVSRLVEIIRRHDKAGLLDDGLCDLREDVRLTPAMSPATPRFVLIKADEVPEGAKAEYYGPEVTKPEDYVTVNNNLHADFIPRAWPRSPESVWACLDTWAVQHPSNKPRSVNADPDDGIPF